MAPIALPAIPAPSPDRRPAWAAALLAVDAGLRLGPAAVGAWLGHKLLLAAGLPQRRLADAPAPAGQFVPPSAPAAPVLPPGAVAVIAAALERLPPAPSASAAPLPHGLRTDFFADGDIRAFWETHRLGALPLLAQAARLGLVPPARGEECLAAWSVANPPFRGPNWACGQEAAIRALHLALALMLLGADAAPPPGARAFLALHAQRIAAAPLYARAQDNNHPLSEVAGLYVIGLLLRDATLSSAGAQALGRTVARLVAADGEFAQPSPQYHRLLLDTLSVAAVFARRLDGPALPAVVAERAATATRWLARVTDPATGALPRIGHGDDSAIADLSLRGPQDARGSVERAARIFCGASAGYADDPGCAWLGLPDPGARLAPAPAWHSATWRGWTSSGARGVLRGGARLRFRPAHCDLLHLDLWDGSLNLLRDGGTGTYRDGPDALRATAGHNTIAFDGTDQMPRIGRFLHARWPRCQTLPDGAAIRDHAGRTHERRIRVDGRTWTIEDRVRGPFTALALRWRLAPLPWRVTDDGVAGSAARIVIVADAPLAIALRPGQESLAYGSVTAAPVLEARASAPVSRLVTTVLLP